MDNDGDVTGQRRNVHVWSHHSYHFYRSGIVIGIVGLVIIAVLIYVFIKPSEFIPDNEWRKKVSDLDTERCVNDIISTKFDYNTLNESSNNLWKETLAISFVKNGELALKKFLDTKKDADIKFIATAFFKVVVDREEVIYNQSKGKYRCNFFNIAEYQIKEYNGNNKSLSDVFTQFVTQYAKSEFEQLDTNGIVELSSLSFIFMLYTAYQDFIEKAGYDLNAPAMANSNNNAHALANKGTDVNTNVNSTTTLHDAARQGDVTAPTPTATPNHNASDTEKRCDTQTISKEKHLPKWNIEIVDSSVIASMLKDAEKNHLPFLKINASDNLKQKLEDYINKNPSKLHKDSQNAFTCEPGNYIKTASNIGIQLVLCKDEEMSVAFLNLVSPVDNKARVYTAKTFDHLFEDAPVITKTEETIINGERGAYVAVKYEIYYDGTGHDRSETDIVHYLFLGDKLRFLSDWNAFHIVEDWYYHDDGTEEYDCDAKTTVLRLENSGAKHQEHTFSNTAAPAPSVAAPTPSPAPAQNTGDSKTKSIAATIMGHAEHEISMEEGKTVGQFFSIKKGLKPCLKSPSQCSKTIAPLVDESYVKFNRGVIAAILLQNNDTFDKDLFKEVQKSLLIPMTNASERMRIANKSPVGREIMGANTLSNDDKINIFAIWYLRQFPYAGEDIWNNTPSTRRSWKDYLEMADLYLDAI